MSSVGGITNGSSHLQPMIETSKSSTEETAVPPVFETPAVAEGVKVSLSGVGIEKAAGSKDDNRDIEESGLPNNIQQILKMIRKLKQQIAEKMAELQTVMADKRLTPEQIRAKAGALQSALATLNGGLLTANTALAKAMKEAGLSPEQLLKAASLLMKS